MDEKSSRKRAFLNVAKTAFKMTNTVAPLAVYEIAFKRYKRPDYTLYPGEYCIERYKGRLTREEFTIDSDGVPLASYYYKSGLNKGLVIVCHGLHSGNDDYLPIIEWMVKRGFNVLGFNYKGTYESGGDSCVGMSESLVDLDHVLDYVLKTPRFSSQPLFLIGHSWGGFAVTSISSLKKNVKAVAALAPMNDAYNMMVDKGGEYIAHIADSNKPMFDKYQKDKFGDYVNYNGVKGINARFIPYLIAQGLTDKVITMKGTSVAAHEDEIINPYVQFFFRDGDRGGHDNIWHSERSVIYRKEVDEQMKEYKKDINTLRSYVASVDHHLYSEVDEELMNEIALMFERCLK